MGSHKNFISLKEEKDQQNWITDATKIYNKRVRFLDLYNKKYPLTFKFKSYLHNFLRGIYFLQLLAPLKYKSDGHLDAQYDVVINDILKEINLLNDTENVGLLWPAVSLKNWIFKDKQPVSLKQKYDLIKEDFHGLIQRFLLSDFIQESLRLNSKSEIDSLITEFAGDQPDDYSELIADELHTKIFEKGGQGDSLSDYYGMSLSWSEFLAKQAGNVVFVDLWASWCVPCRKEMPYSKKIGEEFKDKSFVFIYLSIDKSFRQWKTAMEEEDIPPSHSFIFQNFDSSEMKKRFKIQGIPRYVIYDKVGQVINSNAPHPSDSMLKSFLLKSIEE